jgi:hypothetical protein
VSLVKFRQQSRTESASTIPVTSRFVSLFAQRPMAAARLH